VDQRKFVGWIFGFRQWLAGCRISQNTQQDIPKPTGKLRSHFITFIHHIQSVLYPSKHRLLSSLLWLVHGNKGFPCLDIFKLLHRSASLNLKRHSFQSCCLHRLGHRHRPPPPPREIPCNPGYHIHSLFFITSKQTYTQHLK